MTLPSSEKKHLEMVLKQPLRESGFNKSGSTWHRKINNFIQVINIQGSQWGKQFYFNLVIYITDLGLKEKPLEYECHMRNRAEDLVNKDTELLKLLDFECLHWKNRSYDLLIDIIRNRAIPYLDYCCTPDGITSEMKISGRIMIKAHRDQIKDLMSKLSIIKSAQQDDAPEPDSSRLGFSETTSRPGDL